MFQAARKLRSGMTPAESRLWESLRHRRLGGLRFRRQHGIGRVVLDFYCAAHKLAVEVDGGIHDTAPQAERDAERTRFLAGMEIRVVRVHNDEVLTDITTVLRRIVLAAQDPPTDRVDPDSQGIPPCSPPSLAGEGPGVGGASDPKTS